MSITRRKSTRKPPTIDVAVKKQIYASLPCHSKDAHMLVRDSALTSHVSLDYKGFQNLTVLLLVASNLRLVIENFLKYGVLFGSASAVSSSSAVSSKGVLEEFFLAVAFTSLVAVCASFTLLIEWSNVPTKSSSHQLQKHVALFLHVVNQIFMFSLTISLTYYYIDSPLAGCMPCLVSTAALLKTVSFLLVNSELRAAYIANSCVKVSSDSYPSNLNVAELAYFTGVPTLCYQINYPRTERIRWGFVVKRLAEIVVSGLMVGVLFGQYVQPILENSVRSENKSLLYFVERVLKLSVPGVAAWLIAFYAVFHSYLNIWAELLRFGDRQFYLPWWNARTIADYWRLWNLPVYNWVKRHVNAPLRNRGYPRWVSHLVVFTMSAAAHEVLIGVPLKVGVDFIFGGQSSGMSWAFIGMLMQVPLIILTETIQWIELGGLSSSRKIKTRPHSDSDASVPPTPLNESPEAAKKEGRIGNYVFWISFCIVGQPLIVLMYYRAYYLRHNPQLLQQQ